MSREAGFSLPDSYIYSVLWVPVLLVGAVAWGMTLMLGHTSANAQLSVAAAMVPLGFLFYLGMKHDKHVHLSPDGFRGKGRFGLRQFFPWSRHVLITVDDIYALETKLDMIKDNTELKSLVVTATDEEAYLRVPLVIVRTAAFMQKLREYAPAGHPLLLEAEAQQLARSTRRRQAHPR